MLRSTKFYSSILVSTFYFICLTACTTISRGDRSMMLHQDVHENGSSREEIRSDAFEIPTCRKNHGTIALVESTQQDDMINMTGVTNAALRIFIQKSGCFTVVDRGFANLLLTNERNLPKNRMSPTIDYVLQARAIYQDLTTNDFSIGTSMSRAFETLTLNGGINSGLATSKTEVGVALMLIDARTGIQTASQFGIATKSDASVASFNSAAFNSYSPSGKTTAAALMDAYARLINDIETRE